MAGTIVLGMTAIVLLGGRGIGDRHSLRDIAAESQLAEGEWRSALAYELNAPSLVFYGRRDVDFARSAAEASAAWKEPGTILFCEAARRPEIERALGRRLRVVAARDPFLALASP
jgi:hypothetical protein